MRALLKITFFHHFPNHPRGFNSKSLTFYSRFDDFSTYAIWFPFGTFTMKFFTGFAHTSFGSPPYRTLTVSPHSRVDIELKKEKKKRKKRILLTWFILTIDFILHFALDNRRYFDNYINIYYIRYMYNEIT